MIIPSLKELFYEKMSNSFNLAPLARIVSSYKDARRIHSWHDEKINNRFNRFSLAYCTVANRQTHFNFSLYIDIVNKKIYAFFDEIESESMILKDKHIPQCVGQFNICGFYEEAYEFLSGDFSNAIESYYADSKFDLKKAASAPDDGIYSLCKFGDASGFARFSRQTKFRGLNLAFCPDVSLDIDRTQAMPDVFFEYGALICNTVTLYVSSDISGEYVYVTDGTYIWSVKDEDFNGFVSSFYEPLNKNDGSTHRQFILLE